MVIVVTAAEEYLMVQRARKRGEQESTDCHIGKTVRLQQQSTQGRSMHRQGLRQEQQVAPTARGLQTPRCSEQKR